MSLPDNEYTRENLRIARERYLAALSGVVTGGLFIAEDNAPGEGERALLRTCGALLKAVTVATYVDGDGEALDGGSDGWVANSSTLSRNEQHDALCTIVSLLSNGSRVLAELRDKGDYRDSSERYDDASDERAVRLAGELALEQEDAANDGHVTQ
jgi:hypothetical protein